MVELKNITKVFKDGERKQVVLDDINLSITDHDFITISGSSGGGKTTLLSIISLLLTPTKGTIYYDGVRLNLKKEKELESVRRENLGFVFQSPNLISCLTPLENITIAANTQKQKDAERYAIELMDRVGLKGKEKANVKTLSGGEAQRVAIIRALINKPKIILCDEPTGALDQNTGSNVISLLKEIHEELKCTLIIVSHDELIANMGKRQLRLEGGKIVEMVRHI